MMLKSSRKLFKLYLIIFFIIVLLPAPIHVNAKITTNNFIAINTNDSIQIKSLFIEEYLDEYIDTLECKPISNLKYVNIIIFINYFHMDKSIDTRQNVYLQEFVDYFSDNYLYINCNSDLLLNYLFLYTRNIKLSSLGFDGNIINWVSNNRDYDWYVDQGNTGIYSYDNCGAAVSTMAIKWSDKSFYKTGEDARNKYLLGGGWWYTDTVVQYMNDYNIFNYYQEYKCDKNQFKDLINRKQLIILCIDSNYLSSVSNNNPVIGRFYDGSSGHFIIVKGYIETSTNLYLEVYDPNSMWKKNIYDMPKGMLRYYTFEDINESIKNKWKYLIVVDD